MTKNENLIQNSKVSPTIGKIESVLLAGRVLPGFFSVFGGVDYFENIIQLLNRLGWAHSSTSSEKTSIKFLLYFLKNSNFDDLGIELNKNITCSYVLVKFREGIKRTPVLAFLEQHNFYVIFERQDFILLGKKQLPFFFGDEPITLGNPEIRALLIKDWRRIRFLSEDTSVKFVDIWSHQLLQPLRFDIAIKLMYARLWLAGLAESWRNYAYYEHLLRITGPGVDIKEHDGSGKEGFKTYQKIFHQLISLQNNDDLPVIPVDDKLVAFDGAHRIAAAINCGRKLHVIKLGVKSECNASADFFLDPAGPHKPIAREILDESAIEYCRNKPGLVLALIFPNVLTEDFALKELKSIGEICYTKDIILSPSEGAQLLRQAYLGHTWASGSADEPGFIEKTQSCFPFQGCLRAILLDNVDLSKVRDVKKRIREHYKLGNHSIHLTDGDDEVLRMARVLFNQNSIELLKFTGKINDQFSSLLFSYRDWIEGNNLNEELFCVGGSAILALLGLRDAKDIDFIYVGDFNNLPQLPAKVDCHNDQSKYFEQNLNDIIGDPRLHCWYMGIKFCIPRVLIEMKKNRGEIKDENDVILLRNILNDNRSKLLKIIIKYAIQLNFSLRIRLFTYFNKIKIFIKKILKLSKRLPLLK